MSKKQESINFQCFSCFGSVSLIFTSFLNKNFLLSLISTGKSLLFLYQLNHNMTKDCSLNYKFSTWKSQAQICWEHVVYTNFFLFVFVLTFRTTYLHNMFSTCSELGIFKYWTHNSMNNLSSYCGLVDARINASEKDLSVSVHFLKGNSCPYYCTTCW